MAWLTFPKTPHVIFQDEFLYLLLCGFAVYSIVLLWKRSCLLQKVHRSWERLTQVQRQKAVIGYRQVVHVLLALVAGCFPVCKVSAVLISTVLFGKWEMCTGKSRVATMLLAGKQVLLWEIAVGEGGLDAVFAGILCAALMSTLRSDDLTVLESILSATKHKILVISPYGRIVNISDSLRSLLKTADLKDGKAELALLQTIQIEGSTQGYTNLGAAVVAAFRDGTLERDSEVGVVRWGGKTLECSARLVRPGNESLLVLSLIEHASQIESAEGSVILRSVAHELRTPLNAIINLAQETFDSDALTPKGRENTNMLINSAHFLLSTVNDLLDISRIAAENFKLTKQPFYLEDCLHSCLRLIEPQCKMKKLTLKLRYDSLLPEIVYNDPNRLKQVLLNLLSNALKFTLKGAIEVVAVLVSRTMMRISVTDSGIGIPKESQNKIFNAFGKLEGNEKLNPQGCGLGLPISVAIIRSMGGSGLSVDSAPGCGSTFSFELQITSEVPGSLLTLPTESMEYTEDIDEHTPKVDIPATFDLWKEPQSHPDVLVADDSEFNRIVLTTMLRSFEIESDEAFSGSDVIAKVKERSKSGFPYSFIFMDIQMPEMTGVEAAVEIKRLAQEKVIAKTPIIIGCSADISKEEKEKCLSIGMQHFLEKPISKPSLTVLTSKLGFL